MKTRIKERPILFNAPMVRAILAGAKTQTRRVVTKKHFNNTAVTSNNYPDFIFHDNEGSEYQVRVKCPYGQVGDLLWVKETFCQNPEYKGDGAEIIYSADGAKTTIKEWPWKKSKMSSIHMPKRLARIWLRINKVWIQRLHDIPLKDVLKEGVNSKGDFHQLWNSINKHRGYGWNVNPLVWVVEFDRFEKLKKFNERSSEGIIDKFG